MQNEGSMNEGRAEIRARIEREERSQIRMEESARAREEANDTLQRERERMRIEHERMRDDTSEVLSGLLLQNERMMKKRLHDTWFVKYTKTRILNRHSPPF